MSRVFDSRVATLADIQKWYCEIKGLLDDTDIFAKVSSNDLEADYLSNKIVAGSGVLLDIINPGFYETFRIRTTGGGMGLNWERVFPDSKSVAYQHLGTDTTIVRAAGSSTITVAADIDRLQSFELTIDAAAGDQGMDSSYTVDFVYAGPRLFNQTLDDAEVPTIEIYTYATATKLSNDYDNYFITIPVAGTLRIEFPSVLPTAAAKARLKFTF